MPALSVDVDRIKLEFEKEIIKKYAKPIDMKIQWNEYWSLWLITAYLPEKITVDEKIDFLDEVFLKLGKKLNYSMEKISFEII